MFKHHIFPLALLLFFVAASQANAQFVQGNDPLGRPYNPRVGVVRTSRAPNLPKDASDQIQAAFVTGLSNLGGAFPPYEVVEKRDLQLTLSLLKQGKTKEELARRSSIGDLAGVQYLLKLEINSIQFRYLTDTLIDTDKKSVTLKPYCTVSSNMTAKLVDVATTKLVMNNNFDAFGSSVNYAGKFPMHSDSVKALSQMTDAVHAAAKRMITNAVAGLAIVTSVHKEDKGKAEQVILNNAPMVPTQTEDGFNVFALLQQYERDGILFRDVDQIGVVNRGKDYSVSLRNFKVYKGEKKIGEHMQAKTPLLCALRGFPSGPFSATNGRNSLVIPDFANNAAASEHALRILSESVVEKAVGYPLLLDIVDRELYDLVDAERKVQQKTKSDATQAGVTIGGNYVLNVDLTYLNIKTTLEYKTVTEAAPVAAQPNTEAKQAKQGAAQAPPEGKGKKMDSPSTNTTAPTAKPAIKPAAPAQPATVTKQVPSRWIHDAVVKCNATLVKTETGEIVYSNTYTPRLKTETAYSRTDGAEQIRGEDQALRNLSNQLSSGLWKDVFRFLTPDFYLLNIIETGKNGAEKVLTAGGTRAGFYEGMEIEVVERLQENVDGAMLDRDVLIATLKISDIRPETSVCQVKSGGKELGAKWTPQAKLFCRIKR